MNGDLLGAYEKCRACGEYGFSRMHCCSPIWFARRPEDTENECEQVRARDAQAGAETFAAKTDRWAEYSEVSSRQIVLVRPFGGDTWQAFEVYGEVQPVYNAVPIALPVEA